MNLWRVTPPDRTRRGGYPPPAKSFPQRGKVPRSAEHCSAAHRADEGDTETIAEALLFFPSPVSCADILPRRGKNWIVRQVRGLVRIRRTFFVHRPVCRRAGTSRRPYAETSGSPVGGRAELGSSRVSRASGCPRRPARQRQSSSGRIRMQRVSAQSCSLYPIRISTFSVLYSICSEKRRRWAAVSTSRASHSATKSVQSAA